MTGRPATVVEADITRVIKAAKKAGLEVCGVEVTKDGTIRTLPKEAQKKEVDPIEGLTI